ncbi:hypothetical protein EGW08_010104 [Elysia chlorotica]|uniref:Uncharacterized protein n=1 Tax=Elysia chlorotica TaxID=188477 RepID=A0A433TKK6_ELYCH|nr:hypothetical protein EGW08_010104 [Elysia chlorotica]
MDFSPMSAYMDSVRTIAITLLAFQFLAVSPTLSFEIHMPSSDPGGTIKDLISPENSDWWFHETANDTSYNDWNFFTGIADSSSKCSASLSETELRQCCERYYFKHPPSQIIKSRQKFPTGLHIAQITTIFPFYFINHTHKCSFLYNHTHSLRSRLRNNPQGNIHRIKIELARDKLCFDAGESLLSLSSVIPAHFKTCRVKLLPSVQDVQEIRLNPHSPALDLFFVTEKCVSSKLIQVFHLALSCPTHTQINEQKIPFHLEIHSGHGKVNDKLREFQRNPSNSEDKNVETMGIPFTIWNVKGKSRTRSKRQASSNSAPRFAESLYTKNVPENEAGGLTVITITATDDDPGPAGELTYRMVPTNDRRSLDMFTIDSSSGVITTTVKLDYEVMTRHDFAIIATDGALPESQQRSATTSLIIYVDDVNDNPPVFLRNVERIKIPEERAPEHEEFVASATDQDSGKNAEIRYSILNPGQPNDVFVIDPRTGAVSTRRPLDREQVPFYNLTIQAMDQGTLSERKSATISLLVEVLDENDHAPSFERTNYVLNLREDRPPNGTVPVLNITATDLDEGDNALVSYRLNSPNSQNPVFTINEFTGQLFLTSRLDYEEDTEHQLEVFAQDQGVPPKFSSTTVLVRVQDVNDNAPEFYETSYARNVDENVNVGYRVLQVQAEDKDSGDNAKIEYSIVDSGGNSVDTLPFSIDTNTGWVTTNTELNRELEAGYTFVVQAKDGGKPTARSATVSVTISLRDINDNDPKFDQETYEASISEEAKKGDEVMILTATDIDEGDNARMSYRITAGNEDDTFQMRTSQGKGLITVNQKLDARETSRYILTVEVTDVDGRSDTARVTINILDTNRFAPKFQRTAPFAFTVNEDVPIGTSVFKVFATDQDRNENARVTYSIAPQTVFKIDPATGDISTRQALNRESVSSYRLQVTASDNGQPQLSDSEMLLVTVKDVNDNKPRFDVKPEFGNTGYTGQVSEDERPGASILEISATDEDSGVFGQVRYMFAPGKDGNGAFSIDSGRGIIHLAKFVDREEQASYDLVALAVDLDPVNPQTASVTVHIEITDVNDEAPVFENAEFTVLIQENVPKGTTVAIITATDPDEGANARVEYFLDPSPDRDFFAQSGRLGDPAIITTQQSLDYESGKTRYELILRAESDPKFSTARVIILVQDVNDNEPRLEDFTIIFNNFRNAFPPGPIGRIPAYDPDVSDQDKLVYKILAGNEAGLLRLNEASGELTLDPGLDSDVPRSGMFQMSVSDNATEVTASCRLLVRLVTQDMLYNAVTIRLSRMTQSAFLSQVHAYFLDALAQIFSVPDPPEQNIFLIDVEQDTDVSPEDQILNVSVAIRKGSFLELGRTRDVFFAPEYLREVIYLHRALLANLSTLQVSFGEEYKCIKQLGLPNYNYKYTSNPPPHTHTHTTPFSGQNETKMCDTEIDLCYSFPCQNKGTCLSKEGGYTCVCPSGFTGSVCEYDLSVTYDSLSCPASQCSGPSFCQPGASGEGFQCAGCPSGPQGGPDPHRDAQCRLRTRSFTRGSYLTFPSLKARNKFTIKLRFATQESDGLLLYNGRLNGQHDFLALALVSGQVRLALNLGSNVTVTATTSVQGGVSNGHWTSVTVEYHARVATVYVGDDCDPEIVINFKDKLGPYACAVRVEIELPDYCSNLMKNCNRLLDLTGPLQVGGLPVLPNSDQLTKVFGSFSGKSSDIGFVGCISDLHVEHGLLDLDAAIAEHLTSQGCPAKEERCLSSPCKLGGTCVEGWNTFLCECPERTGGKDCSQTIEPSRQLRGDGYLSYSELPQQTIRYPWILGVAFRTREPKGTLMHVLLDTGDVTVELTNGLVTFKYRTSVLTLGGVRVDNGQWHHLQVRWEGQTSLRMFLDYGVYDRRFNMTTSVSGKTIEIVYVGASRTENLPMSNFFTGCVKDILVGGSDRSSLLNPNEFKVDQGCQGSDVCSPNPCGAGQCQDDWNHHSCHCPAGTTGPECLGICTHYNPCQNWAECRRPSLPGETTYSCECGSRQSGRYCEHQSPLTCADGYWGKPVCGPCNCKVEKGFLEMCDKSNGQCSCKSLHYLPPGSDTCIPCDCYDLGSVNLTCHPTTGQCHCHEGVIGRRCDQCDNMYAAVKMGKRKVNETAYEQVITCVVSYDDCPRNHAGGIWWDEIAFGLEAEQDCPAGAIGNATRKCTEKESWLQPDLFQCSTEDFIYYEPQISNFEKGLISPFSANSVVSDLQNVSYTASPIYGGDILLVYRLTKVLLEYEIRQMGLRMISQQYRDFVQKLLVVLSNVTDEQYVDYWQEINSLTVETGGATRLMNLFEAYIDKVVQSLPTAKSGTFEAVSDDMVLGSDWLDLTNFTGATIPKYNNNVKKGSVDKEVSAYISPQLLSAVSSAAESNQAYFGYVVYRDFGKHVSMETDSSIRRSKRNMTVNGPILSLVMSEHGPLSEPVLLHFRLQLPNNRTNLHCVRWKPSSDSKSGEWTASDCTVDTTECRVSSESDRCEEYYVTCACKHLSTYAVIIDIADGTTFLPPLVDMEVVTYILMALSILLLLLSFFILFTFKRLQCNWNSIRINIVFTVFIVDLAHAIGINRTSSELFCRLVAISLHYFYMAFFAWLFVEVMHIYRMMTEKQTINYGAMKFYYLLGYVIPGIVVGLAVGLYTGAYGNESFCWLSTSDGFIWSFAGPVSFAVVVTIIMFVFAAKASCADKIPVNDIGLMRSGLLTAMLLLFLMSTTWVLGLTSVNYRSTPVHYLHGVFTCIAACFIFLVYIVLSKKVRWCIKRFYYRMKGKKIEFDENLTRSNSVAHSRSALAYRHESPSTEGVSSVARGVTNIGISTTSTSPWCDKYRHLHHINHFPLKQ